MDNILTPITIGQLQKADYQDVTFYKDDLIITNSLGYIEFFKYPCRLDAISILICLEGSMECNINLQRIVVGKNTLVICRSCDIIQIIDSKNLKAFAGVVSTEYINELKLSFWQQNIHFSPQVIIRHLTESDITLIKYFYPQLCDNIRLVRKESDNIIKSLIQALIYTLSSIINNGQGEEGVVNTSRTEQIFNKFMNLLSVYHGKERSVTFYAGKMCITPNYLSGEVKASSGKTALEWINEYVILEAKTLLKYTKLSVQEISYQLNFPTQSAFGKYFKKFTGIGPKEFRKI
ncbi:MAG: AraC family transcriptional regulator [Bacteroidales bacterium]|nr:AraC family transcriptional regulator [Bacteroidales bacterium]